MSFMNNMWVVRSQWISNNKMVQHEFETVDDIIAHVEAIHGIHECRFHEYTFSTEAIEGCRRHKGRFQFNQLVISACTFYTNPVPVIELFNTAQQGLFLLQGNSLILDNGNDWSEVGQSCGTQHRVELHAITNGMLMTLLQGMNGMTFDMLSCRHCMIAEVYDGPEVTIHCSWVQFSVCTFRPGTWTRFKFPDCEHFMLQDMLFNDTRCVESMIGLKSIRCSNIRQLIVLRLLQAIRSDQIQSFEINVFSSLNASFLNPLLAFIKAHPSMRTLSFSRCLGSTGEIKHFLKQIQFLPLRFQSFMVSQDPNIDWTNVMIDLNQRLRANQDFIKRLARDPFMKQLPQEDRYELYELQVGKEWKTLSLF